MVVAVVAGCIGGDGVPVETECRAIRRQDEGSGAGGDDIC